jgi:hypothetical protein
MPPTVSSSTSQPSPKKRRTTVSGSSQPVNQVSPNPSSSDTKAPSPPIIVSSPPMDHNELSTVEQGCPISAAKHNQEALNEFRRESLGGPLQSTSHTAVSPAMVKPPGSSRTSARSPNMGVARITRTSDAPSGPNPISAPGLSQHADPSTHPSHQNSLPPTSISFAGRRAFKSPSSQQKNLPT